MEELRAYIRAVMKAKNLKGIHVEAQSDGKITDSTLSDILTGKTKTVALETIKALAQGLAVDATEVFRAATGEKVDYSLDDPWPGRVLTETMQKIMDSADLTVIVKILVELKPTKIKALRKQLEKE
jgi:transcriptional regulator with XRE-family HTH domain